ncbi:MAG: hypothetical protein Q4G03_07725 [Planctomycetia bacterium]|nr:hypothetical protein [Planctomycetia bacterium]
MSPSQSEPLSFTRLRRATLACLLCALASLCLSGCTSAQRVKLPNVVSDNPSAHDLVDAVNRNSAKIKSLASTSSTIGVDNMPGWARCYIYYDEPNKLSVSGSALMQGSIMVCGCDGEKFWFWINDSNNPPLYYCRLDQYQNSQVGQYLPLEPTWFPEILGVVHINDEDILEEPVRLNDGTMKLIVKKTRSDGVYRKHVYFEPKTAAIKRQDIQAPNGETVLSVVCREHQYLEEEGVVLPKKLSITCPSNSSFPVVSIDFDQPTLNDSSAFTATTFAMPEDVASKKIDLGNQASTVAIPEQQRASDAAATAPTNNASNATVITTAAPNAPTVSLQSPTVDSTPVNNGGLPAASTLPPGSGLTPTGQPYDASGTAKPYVGAGGVVPFPTVASNTERAQNPASATAVADPHAEPLQPSAQLNSSVTPPEEAALVANTAAPTFAHVNQQQPAMQVGPLLTNPPPTNTAPANNQVAPTVQTTQPLVQSVAANEPRQTFAPIYPGLDPDENRARVNNYPNSASAAPNAAFASTPSQFPGAASPNVVATAPALVPTYNSGLPVTANAANATVTTNTATAPTAAATAPTSGGFDGDLFPNEEDFSELLTF